jgi:Ca2+/Na+ antiporter
LAKKFIIAYFLAFSLSFLMMYPKYFAYTNQSLDTEKGLNVSYSNSITEVFGLISTILFVLGIFLILKISKEKNFNKSLGIVLACICIIILAIVFFVQFNFGSEIMYRRAYMFSLLFMGIIASYSIYYLRKIEIKKIKIGLLISLILLGTVLYESYNIQKNEPYYTILTEKNYEEYLWIKNNLEPGKVVMDPWKANGFVQVTEFPVYIRITQGPSEMRTERLSKIYNFFSNNCTDLNFLKENNISIIYHQNCKNDRFEKIKSNIYIYKIT